MKLPCLDLEMTFQEYRNQKEFISVSELNLVPIPELFQHVVLEGNRRKPTKNMELGTALHSLVLENTFHSGYYQLPDLDYTLASNKKTRHDLAIQNEGKISLKFDDFEDVVGAGKSVYGNLEAAELLKGCLTEVSFFWKDDHHGQKCKGRADAFNQTDDYVVDLKSSADPLKFEKSIAEYGYHRQAAHYMDGLSMVTGRPVKNWYWVVVSMSAPYICRVYRAHPESIQTGRLENRRMLGELKNFKTAQLTQESEPTVIKEIGLPSWYRPRF